MFGSKSKAIDNLTQRTDRMREQRDWARAQHDTSREVTGRIARKFTDNHDLAWDEAAFLADQVDGYQNLLTRHARLLRAAGRYLVEIWRLRAEVAKLRTQAGVPDRAVDPAVPTPALLRALRERDVARAQLRPLQERLEVLQRLSEAADRKLAERAGTRVDTLQVAS